MVHIMVYDVSVQIAMDKTATWPQLADGKCYLCALRPSIRGLVAGRSRGEGALGVA